MIATFEFAKGELGEGGFFNQVKQDVASEDTSVKTSGFEKFLGSEFNSPSNIQGSLRSPNHWLPVANAIRAVEVHAATTMCGHKEKRRGPGRPPCGDNKKRRGPGRPPGSKNRVKVFTNNG